MCADERRGSSACIILGLYWLFLFPDQNKDSLKECIFCILSKAKHSDRIEFSHFFVVGTLLSERNHLQTKNHLPPKSGTPIFIYLLLFYLLLLLLLLLLLSLLLLLLIE